MYSISLVPLYDTLGAEALAFIINQAQLSIVVCDEPSKVNFLSTQIPNKFLAYKRMYDGKIINLTL